MTADYRETKVRIFGVEKTVRTERTGTVKQLEAAHTKAVKAAIIDLRTSGQMETFGADEAADKARKATKLPRYNWEDARKGFPKVTYTAEVPNYLVQTAPGEYVTEEVATDAGMAEYGEEILTGLTVRRYWSDNRWSWSLHHLRSADEQYPNGRHLGPLFRTRQHAVQVANEELAHIDWTREVEDLMADPAVGPLVRWIAAREYVNRHPSEYWAEEKLRKAEEELAASQRPAA